MARIWQNGFETVYTNINVQAKTETIKCNNYDLAISNTRDTAGNTTDSTRKMYIGEAPGKGGYGSKSLCVKSIKEVYDAIAIPNRATISVPISTKLGAYEFYTSFWYKVEKPTVGFKETSRFPIFEVLGYRNGGTFVTIDGYPYSDFYKLKVSKSVDFSFNVGYDKWNKIDIRLRSTGYSGNSGILELKVNDILIGTFVGDYSEYVSGGSRFDIGYVKYCIGNLYGNGDFKFYIDDILLNDTSDTINNTWCVSESVLDIKPIANGSKTEFTPLSGANYENIDDLLVSDGDLSYNSTTNIGSIDTFRFQPLSIYNVPNDAIVTGVTLNYTSKVDGTVCGIKGIEYDGVDYKEVSTPTITTDYSTNGTSINSILTANEFNNREYGYKFLTVTSTL